MNDFKWQPIETAPKDGSNFLTIGRLNNGAWGSCGITHIFYSHVVGDKGYRLSGDNAHYATHWRPLPEPPSDD